MPVVSNSVFAVSYNGSLVLLLVITALGVAARLYQLTVQNMWMDEVALIDNVHVFDRSGLRGLAHFDHVAPLHTLILWAVSKFFGDGVLAMRLPSVVIGTLTIPAFYALAYRLFHSRSTALVSAALVAISPFAVWYSQEARMYALLLLCATVYVTVAWPVVKRSLTKTELFLLTAVTTIGLYAHHYMIMVAVAFGLFLICRGGLVQKRAWVWAITQIIALVLFTYWLYLGTSLADAWGGASKPEILLWTPYALFTFVFGFSFGPGVRDIRVLGTAAALHQHAFSIGVGCVAASMLGVLGTQRAMRREHRIVGMWLVVWLVVPILLAVLATLVTNISYNVRYVVTAFPPVILVFGLAITDPRSSGRILRLVTATVLIACMVVSLWNWYFSTEYAKENTRPVAELLANADHHEVLVIDNFTAVPVLRYYGAALPPLTYDLDNRYSNRLADYVIGKVRDVPQDPAREVWFIEYRSWATDPTGQIRAYLDSNFTFVNEQDWTGVTLRRYR